MKREKNLKKKQLECYVDSDFAGDHINKKCYIEENFEANAVLNLLPI